GGGSGIVRSGQRQHRRPTRIFPATRGPLAHGTSRTRIRGRRRGSRRSRPVRGRRRIADQRADPDQGQGLEKGALSHHESSPQGMLVMGIVISSPRSVEGTRNATQSGIGYLAVGDPSGGGPASNVIRSILPEKGYVPFDLYSALTGEIESRPTSNGSMPC